MSREESCYEGNSRNSSRVTKYSVRRLEWESRTRKKFLKNLTSYAKKNLTTRAKDRILPRVGGQLLLKCPATENFPEWAIMQ